MIFKSLAADCSLEISNLFTATFTDSEGEAEGKLIGDLANKLALNIDEENIFCFATYDENLITGAVFFSRLFFKDNAGIKVYMLAPVAVKTENQGAGLGKGLIQFALNQMQDRSVDVAITYGDPGFYAKVGFLPLSEDLIQAPLTLSMPQGWLGQSLKNSEIPKISERPTCVEAFNNPAYW